MVVPKVEEKEVKDEKKEPSFETIRGPSNKANDWFFSDEALIPNLQRNYKEKSSFEKSFNDEKT